MLRGLKGWFLALSTIGKVGVITGASVVALGTAGAATNSQNHDPTAVKGANTSSSTPAPTIDHKTVVTTEPIQHDTQTVNDATLAVGTDQVTTEGVNGLNTKSYDVTYTNGTETGRSLIKDEVTTAPVTKVISHGTYIAPVINCPNGTYVNTAGNTVCSPYNAPSTPSGATAQCRDGTYSFSQSRSGTCSHHGGVSEWL